MKQSEILRRIKASGIETLNPMQQAVAASRATDLVLLAPTGSGKTLAFTLALLRSLPEPPAGLANDRVRAVVLAPSRELAMQIFSVLRPIAAPTFHVKVLYGGSNFAAEEASMRSAVPAIVIATPGRLLDHINRQTINVSTAMALVVDEYDKTLELGFHEELRRITARLKHLNCTILTSATPIEAMPAFIHADKAETIDFTEAQALAANVAVINMPSAERDKINTLAALLRTDRGRQAMVFVNHRESAERVVQLLAKQGIEAELYHGGLEQRQREVAIAKFRAGAANILVSTDLAARGLDITGVDCVVHYHMPVNEQAWKHRNGRTARAGATGTVYVITGPDEDTPEFVVTDHDEYPDLSATGSVRPKMTMLYITAGKREKVSRGDVAGFVMKQCGVDPAHVGLITVGFDYALVAVDAADARQVMETARTAKLKNKRVRITPV